MTNVGKAYVEVSPKTDNFEKELSKSVDQALDNVQKQTDDAAKEVGKSVSGMGSVFKDGISKAVLPATAALAGIGAMASKAVGATSDLGESINAVNVVYGRAAEGILQLSKDAATAVGLSRTEFNAFAVQFSSFAEKIAGPGGDIVGTIESISGRAADFASVMNMEVADAAQIFQSGLAGETEPLKRYGIDLSEAAVKAYAAANGIGSASGELTEQEKILARYGSLMAQTQKTQGDFANTSDSLANRTRIAKAEFGNLMGEIGDRLIPIFETLLGVGQQVVAWAKNNQTTVYVLVGAVAALSAGVIAVNAAFKVYSAVTKVITAAQWAWNAALAANPITLIVLGVVALIGVLAAAYVKFDGFRMVVNKVINFVIGAFEMLVNSWITAINFIVSGINKFTGLFSKIGIDIPKIAEIGEVSFGRLSTSIDNTTKATEQTTSALSAEEQAAIAAAGANTELTTTTTKAGGAASKTADQVKKLRDSLGDSFKSTLEKAKTALDNAKDAYREFAKSVSEAVTSSFSFQDAYEAGQESGSGFFSALTDQANKVQDFSVLINRLMAAGLSQEALQQVLDAGVVAGSAIANEILNTADGVIQANNLVAQVASVGEQIGTNAADKFKKAGVDAGTALVNGITEVISKYQVNLKSKKLTARQLKRLQQQFAVDVSFAFSGSGLPELANGAIVNSRTPAIIGEAGAEAVIPITRPARALQLMEQSGLASLARSSSGAAVNIENATFVAPIDADLVAQKVLVAERARSL